MSSLWCCQKSVNDDDSNNSCATPQTINLRKVHGTCFDLVRAQQQQLAGYRELYVDPDLLVATHPYKASPPFPDESQRVASMTAIPVHRQYYSCQEDIMATVMLVIVDPRTYALVICCTNNKVIVLGQPITAEFRTNVRIFAGVDMTIRVSPRIVLSFPCDVTFLKMWGVVARCCNCASPQTVKIVPSVPSVAWNVSLTTDHTFVYGPQQRTVLIYDNRAFHNDNGPVQLRLSPISSPSILLPAQFGSRLYLAHDSQSTVSTYDVTCERELSRYTHGATRRCMFKDIALPGRYSEFATCGNFVSACNDAVLFWDERQSAKNVSLISSVLDHDINFTSITTTALGCVAAGTMSGSIYTLDPRKSGITLSRIDLAISSSTHCIATLDTTLDGEFIVATTPGMLFVMPNNVFELGIDNHTCDMIRIAARECGEGSIEFRSARFSMHANHARDGSDTWLVAVLAHGRIAHWQLSDLLANKLQPKLLYEGLDARYRHDNGLVLLGEGFPP